MADKKISALTASSTPLAGTEVLPIVQSGATVKVAVSDLTAGRAISATQVTLSTGNLVIGTAAKGIDFSANTHGAGMTSELLNYYEEGNWTPSQGGQLVVVGAFSSEGRYTRIGRVIHFTGYVAGATSVALTAVGQLTSNLPYNTGNTFLGVAAATNANSSAGSILSISITSLYNVTTIAATTKIYFSGTYII